MPNWCFNSLHMEHENPDKIRDIVAILLNKQELFDAIYPTPPDKLDEGWYDWRIENWGTKWNPNVDTWEVKTNNHVYLTFDTAWSPPISLYRFMEDDGFKIDAYYREDGMGFEGEYKTNGEGYHRDIDYSEEELVE